MMDLINRKHNKRRCKRVHAMEVQESTFDRLNKRHSELSDRGQVQQKGKNRSRKFMQKVSTSALQQARVMYWSRRSISTKQEPAHQFDS